MLLMVLVVVFATNLIYLLSSNNWKSISSPVKMAKIHVEFFVFCYDFYPQWEENCAILKVDKFATHASQSVHVSTINVEKKKMLVCVHVWAYVPP